MGYIYIVLPADSVVGKLNIFKVGKTDRTIDKRFAEYEKGAKLLIAIEVDNCSEVESKLMKALKDKFKNVIAKGSEYFEANEKDLKKHVFDFCNEFESTAKLSVDNGLAEKVKKREEHEKQIGLVKERIMQQVNNMNIKNYSDVQNFKSFIDNNEFDKFYKCLKDLLNKWDSATSMLSSYTHTIVGMLNDIVINWNEIGKLSDKKVKVMKQFDKIDYFLTYRFDEFGTCNRWDAKQIFAKCKTVEDVQKYKQMPVKSLFERNESEVKIVKPKKTKKVEENA